jgi:phosphatidylinositol alpha-1,6-mannosyltransferase
MTVASSGSSTRVIAFLPSLGLGGGIERYNQWLLHSLEVGGIEVVRVPLRIGGERPTLWRKVRFIGRCFRALSRSKHKPSVVVLVAHPSLGIACSLASRLARIHPLRSWLLYYGQDSWSLSRWERRILVLTKLAPITISSFSAGTLAGTHNAPVLVPGLHSEWYAELARSQRSEPSGSETALKLITVFRLPEAEAKGLPTIIEAVTRLRQEGHMCTLTVAGSGSLEPWLQNRVNDLPWLSLIASPSDEKLASLYAGADLFVLATRTSHTGHLSGEGFGIVLVEAQLAGTPVVAPAFGGSSSAFLDRLTGLSPADESAESLVRVLSMLIADRPMLHKLGVNAQRWAAVEFEPTRRAQEACEIILGSQVAPSPLPLELVEETRN